MASNNEFKRKLLKYLEDNDIDIDWLANEYLKIGKNHLLSKRKGFPEEPNSQKPFDLSFVQQLVLSTNIDPETFALPKKQEEKWKKKQGNVKKWYFKGDPIITKWSPSPVKNVLNLDHNYHESRNEKEYVKKYLKAIRPFIKNNSHLAVSDFLGKGLNEKPGVVLGAYHRAHRILFRDIYNHLKNNSKAKYKRLLTLPIESIENLGLDEQKEEAIINCSEVTFEHIIKCLRDIDKERIIFSVAPALRLINYGLIFGKSKLIFTEYYKYAVDSQGGYGTYLVPDFLYIKECSKYGSILDEQFDALNNEVNMRVKDPDTFLTKNNIENITFAAYERISKQGVDDNSTALLKKSMARKIAIFKHYM